MERLNEEGRMQFHFVTGTCKNCGGNKFKFDPKEQTFVCEYCQTEVYAVSPLPEQEKEPDNEGIKVEPIKEEKADDNNVSGANVEPKEEEESVYSGYSGSDSPASTFFSMIVGTILVLLRPLLYDTGILEKLLANGEASVESSEGVAPAITQTSEVLETMLKGIGSDAFLTFAAVFGLVITMMGTVKLIKSLMRGY